MITGPGRLLIKTVNSVTATNEPGVYIVNAMITDDSGITEACDYVSRPDDIHGLNPSLRAWLSVNLGKNVPLRQP